MKIKIKFEETDSSVLEKVKFTSGGGTCDEIAATVFTLVQVSEVNLEWVIAGLLSYSDGGWEELNQAMKEYLAREERNDETDSDQ